MDRRFAGIFCATMLLAACSQPGTPPIEVTDAGNARPETHCYLQVTKNPPMVVDTDTFPSTPDSLYIRLDILGELVNGVFNWLPGEQDPRTGAFAGTVEKGSVTALYTYTTEDLTAKEEVLFKVEPGGLRVGAGELVESEGVWLFKDKSQAAFGDLIPEIPCK